MALRNIVGAVIFLAFALWYGDVASQLPKRESTNAPGPHFFPYLIATAIFILAGMLLVKGLLGLKEVRGLADLIPKIPPSNESYSLRRGAIGLAMIGAYLLALPWIGFFWATPFFFLSLMWLAGERRPHFLLGLSIAVPMFLYFLFSQIFQLPLPKGSLLG